MLINFPMKFSAAQDDAVQEFANSDRDGDNQPKIVYLGIVITDSTRIFSFILTIYSIRYTQILRCRCRTCIVKMCTPLQQIRDDLHAALPSKHRARVIFTIHPPTHPLRHRVNPLSELYIIIIIMSPRGGCTGYIIYVLQQQQQEAIRSSSAAGWAAGMKRAVKKTHKILVLR